MSKRQPCRFIRTDDKNGNKKDGVEFDFFLGSIPDEPAEDLHKRIWRHLQSGHFTVGHFQRMYHKVVGHEGSLPMSHKEVIRKYVIWAAQRTGGALYQEPVT